MSNYKLTKDETPPAYDGENPCCGIYQAMPTTSNTSPDTIQTDHFKNGVEVTQRKSQDSGNSRDSTLLGIEIGRAVKQEVSTSDKILLLCLMVYYVITLLANVTLATALLPYTGPNSTIQGITVKFSLFTTYFDPLAMLLAIAVWDLVTPHIRTALFALRFGFTFASAIMTGLDASSSATADIPSGDTPYILITALCVLLSLSLPLLAFETFAAGCSLPEDEEGKTKAVKSQRKTQQDAQGGVELV